MINPFVISIKTMGFLALLLLLFSCDSVNKESSSNDTQIELNSNELNSLEEPIPEPEPQPRPQLSSEQIAYNDFKDQGFKEKIPKKVWSAIHEYDSTFESWTSYDFVEDCGQTYIVKGEIPEDSRPSYVPWGVRGDFNEDRKNDFAILGHNQTQDLILVAMRKGSSYEIIEIAKFETLSDPRKFGIDYYLEFMENCIISVPNEDYSFPLHGDAFIIVYCDGPEILRYLEDGEFASFPMTDWD